MSDVLDPTLDDDMTEGGEDNSVIKTLRSQLAEAKAAAKAAQADSEKALVDARIMLERESTAQRLMDAAGYPGMTNTVLEKVEGELTADKVVAALEGLSLQVDKDEFVQRLAGEPVPARTETQSASSLANEIASVASLGGQISAAAKNTQESNFGEDLAATNSLADVVALAEKHGFNDPT